MRLKIILRGRANTGNQVKHDMSCQKVAALRRAAILVGFDSRGSTSRMQDNWLWWVLKFKGERKSGYCLQQEIAASKL